MQSLKRVFMESENPYMDTTKRQCLNDSTVPIQEPQEMQVDEKPTIDYDLHPALLRKFLNGSFC
jgi:hypothetical protein